MSLRLAFASTDGKVVDEHFGTAPRFHVFTLDPDCPRRSAIIVCETGEGHDDNRLGQRITALRECRAVLCTAIGQGALRKLRASGIEAVRVAEGSDIAGLLNDWLAGRLGVAPKTSEDEARFDQYLTEGWQT